MDRLLTHGGKVSHARTRLFRVDPSGHWIWLGPINRDGYGYLLFRGYRVAAHRMAYELAHGPLKPDVHVLHECDVKCCVRLTHLKEGTQADNMAGMKARGRGHSKKLTRAALAPWNGELP